MIEHADAALDAWLRTLDPPVEVTFERDIDAGPSRSGGKAAKPIVQLALSSVREQRDKRDNVVDDVRGADGRVVARQRQTRFFEVDYLCSVHGTVADAHRTLGDLLQLLVDHDVLPDRHVPTELRELGHPIDVRLVTSSLPSAAVTVQLVLPVRPTPESEIGPPTTSLHLDMAPPPEPRRALGSGTTRQDPSLPPIEERKWTRVRRRELIGTQHTSSERVLDG